jgi:hypothetical protein
MENLPYDPLQPIILRCCRDWPCHLIEAVHMNGSCGICKQIPEVIYENYFPKVGNY